MNLGIKETELAPVLCVQIRLTFMLLSIKPFNRISEFLVLGLKGRKDTLLNDLLKPPALSNLGGH